MLFVEQTPRQLLRQLLFGAALATIVLALDSSAVAAADAIAAARYVDPVNRYGHFAAGRPHEYAGIEATTVRGMRLKLALPIDEVFEDVLPRLVRLGPSAPATLLAILSDRDNGSALALLGIENGQLSIVARSAPIGTPNRWLNPVAVADLDGDGIAEIAAVITPHIGGTLKIYRRAGSRLQEVAALDGFSNHAYRSPELGLSAVWKDGRHTRLVVPDAARGALRVVEFAGGRLRDAGRCELSSPVAGPVVVAPDGRAEITLTEGKRVLGLLDCLH